MQLECAIQISEAIINDCIKKNIPLNTSKLIKLLYLMQKEHTFKYNELMFTDEITVGELGPYIYNVYNFFKEGYLGFNKKNATLNNIPFIDSHRNIYNTIIKKYGKYSSFELVNIIEKDPYYINFKNKHYDNINEYFKLFIKDEKTLKLKKND